MALPTLEKFNWQDERNCVYIFGKIRLCGDRDDEDQKSSTRSSGEIVGIDAFREQVREELQAGRKVGRGWQRKNIV